MEMKITIGLVFFTKVSGEALASFLNLNSGGKYKCFPFEFGDTSSADSQPLDYILVEVKQPETWVKTKGLVAKLLKKTRAKIIVIGDSQALEIMAEFVRMGAWTLFLTENNGTADLLELLDQAEKGFCRRDIIDAVVSRNSKNEKAVLTSRQKQMLLLIHAEDLSNKQLARRLNLSLYTVKNHMHSIIKKLGVVDRYEAVRMMFEGQVADDIACISG